MRGIAALTVALWHVTWRNHITGVAFVPNGPLMVDFFFVLSGFVICHSYGSRLRTFAGARRFMIARWGRLYPLHLAMLLVFVAIECGKWIALRFHLAAVASVPFGVNTPGSLVGNLLLIHGLGIYSGPTWNIPSWSISTEFFTYALFALVAIAARNRGIFVAVSAALSIGGLAVSWVAFGGLGDTGRFAFFRCILGFFAGVVTRALYGVLSKLRWPAGVLRWSSVASVAAVLVFLSWNGLRGPDYFYSVPLFMTAILTTALAENAGVRFLHAPVLVWLGTVSYSIYMVHPAIVWSIEFVLQWVLHIPRPDYYATTAWAGDLLVVLYVAIVLLISRWTFRHIEDRFRRRIKSAAA